MLAEAGSVSHASVITALQRASAATGSDFHYLLGTAMRESSLKPDARSATSSATGLFQFVEQTWLGLIKDYGAKYGLGSYAGAISKGSDGRFHVADASDRHAILALRNDPQASALMAGEYARQTQGEMQNALGRPVCGGELYAAHFLGPDAACRLIRMTASTPDAAAANVFPQAAGANRSVFYHANGTSKTVREVYDWAVNQLAPAAPATTVAAATPIAPAVTGTADYGEVLGLLWRPQGGFFGGGEVRTPSLLSQGVLDILSSLSPVAKDTAGS